MSQNMTHKTTSKWDNLHDSTYIVPGDILEIEGNGLILPCDCLLLDGNIDLL